MYHLFVCYGRGCLIVNSAENYLLEKNSKFLRMCGGVCAKRLSVV